MILFEANAFETFICTVSASFWGYGWLLLKRGFLVRRWSQSPSVCSWYLSVIPRTVLVVICKIWSTWWRHQNKKISALLVICAGNSPVTGQWRGALMFSLICAWINGWVKHWWDWWIETPSRPLWRHCNVWSSIHARLWHHKCRGHIFHSFVFTMVAFWYAAHKTATSA